MASLEEIRQTRLEKLELLKKQGINPYPATSKRDYALQEVVEKFDILEKEGKTISLVGRVMSLRIQGGLIFFHLFDGTAKFQGLLKKEEIDEKIFDLFSAVIDIGDFIEIHGTLFITQRGEKTLLVKEWIMLSKSLLPLPEKWHGLQDVEERYRHRYLDILMNPESRSIIELKQKFWDYISDHLKKHSFIEVETPVLEVTTGGAEANPFKTYHKDFDMEVFLRISVGELWQKRLLAAGLPRVFEIGRVYRNEGSSPEHTQEFTNLEFYAAYMDYKEGMAFTEEMLKGLAQEVFGTTKFTMRGFDVDFAGEWARIDYVETIEQKTGVHILKATEQDLMDKLQELKVTYEGNNRERLIDTLWKYCRKQIGGPVWLINHPKIVSPLAKAQPENPELTERAQLILAGAEAANGWSELNNPLDQRERFELQQKLIDRGDAEAMTPDWEFVEMLEHAMPPAFGLGLGERLFSFFVNKPLRETQTFPLMRPEDQGKNKKGKQTKVAVALINKEANMELWQKMNTIGHLTAAFGARKGTSLLKFNTIQTADEKNINLNIQHAIMIKEAPSNADIQKIITEAKEKGLEIAEFTREMLETTNDKKVAENTKAKNFSDIEFLGVLVFGDKDKVEEITKDFELLS